MQSVSLVEVLLVVLVVSVSLASADNSTCIGDRDYHRLESSLLKWPQNLVNLSEAFFPTNRQQSISVQVAYHFNGSNETVNYRWLDSPINLLIRSELLQYLALTMYQVELRYADVTLDPICDFSSENVSGDPGFICRPYNLSDHHLLNNLTVNLLSYAKHRSVVKKNGFDSSTERGYSVYVFGTDPGDYCIFDEVWSFHYLRILLWSSFGTIELAVTLAAPLLMISLYKTVAKKMKDTDSVFRYYVWAMILVSTPLNALMYICNGFTVYNGLNGKSHTKIGHISVAFIALVVVLAGVFVLDVIMAGFSMCILRKVWIKLNRLGYERVNTDGEHNTATSENDTVTSKHNAVASDDVTLHIFLMTSITVFVQLALFHSVFISFAVIAAPIESGSLLLLYLSSLFALISFLALGLKIANNMQRKCIAFSLVIILLIGVAGGVGIFVSFVYKYTLLIQEYRNSSGLISFLRPIILSLLATVGGILTTIVSCKSINPKKEESTQTENTGDGTESSSDHITPSNDVSPVTGSIHSIESAIINNKISVEVHN